MPLPRIEGRLPDAREDETVILLGVDSAYASHHAVPFAYSLDENAPGNHLHLHIVTPQEGLAQALAVMAADLRNTALTWTWENTTLQRPAGISDADLAMAYRTYYACSRFLRIAALMEAAPARWLILDADSIVRKPLDLPNTDAGVFLRPDMPEQMKVAAGVVMMAPTEAGMAFAHLVSESLAHTIDKGLAWYVDQVILWAAVQHMPLKWTCHKFDSSFLSWEMADAAPIWTGKGDLKNTDPKYLELSHHFRCQFRIPDIQSRFWDGAAAGGGWHEHQ